MGAVKSILITGSSTGIGRASALRLDKEGFRVFAGVRRKADGDALKKTSAGKLVPVIIDVTDIKSIQKAARVVADAADGNLYGLMNNAGIAEGSTVEMTPIGNVRNVIETNLVGMIAVTQAFIPMLRKAHGRIVNTASIFGRTALPGSGIYAASKFGIEGLSESLRLELKPFGITVSVIEPGAVATELWRKSKETNDKIYAKTDPEILKLYQKLYLAYEKLIAEQKYLPPETVAESVYHAFTAKNPKRHYLVGKDAKAAAFIERLPEGVRDRLFYKSIYK